MRYKFWLGTGGIHISACFLSNILMCCVLCVIMEIFRDLMAAL